jgi:hypothetical protein
LESKIADGRILNIPKALSLLRPFIGSDGDVQQTQREQGVHDDREEGENPSEDPIDPGAEEVAGKFIAFGSQKWGALLRRLAAPNSGLSYCGRVGKGFNREAAFGDRAAASARRSRLTALPQQGTKSQSRSQFGQSY